MVPIPVWQAKQEVNPFWTPPLCSAFPETPSLWKWHGSINKRQENADTFCLASDTGSDNTLRFTIVIWSWRNSFLPSLTALPFGGSAVLYTAFMPTCSLKVFSQRVADFYGLRCILERIPLFELKTQTDTLNIPRKFGEGSLNTARRINTRALQYVWESNSLTPFSLHLYNWFKNPIYHLSPFKILWIMISQQNLSENVNVDEWAIDFPQSYKMYKTVSDVTIRAFWAEWIW